MNKEKIKEEISIEVYKNQLNVFQTIDLAIEKTAKSIFEEIEKMPISTEGIIFYVDEDEDWEKFKQKWLGEE